MTPNQSVSQFLTQVALFKGLSQAECSELEKYFEERRCKDQETIFTEGESSDGIYVICDGYAEVLRQIKERMVFINLLGAGEAFGEAALFDQLKRTATLKAKGDTHLLLLKRERFFDFLKKHPASGNSILLEMLRRVFTRLNDTSRELRDQRRENLTQDSIDKLFA